MPKKLYLGIIFLTIVINVVMLQWTIEAYFGQEYDHVLRYSIVAVISSAIAIASYFGWRKSEYSK